MRRDLSFLTEYWFNSRSRAKQSEHATPFPAEVNATSPFKRTLEHWRRERLARSLRTAIRAARDGHAHGAILLLRLVAKYNPFDWTVELTLAESCRIADEPYLYYDINWPTEVELYPNRYVAYRAAKLLMWVGRCDSALEIVKSACERHPLCWIGWRLRGELNQHLQAADDAIRCYQRATALAPTSTVRLKVEYALANCLAATGAQASAAAAFHGILAAAPREVLAQARIVDCRPEASLSDHHVRAAMTLLRSPSVTQRERCPLHFAIGRSYDRNGHYAKAFAHFHLGNEIRARQLAPFDLRDLRGQVEERINLFTSELFERLAHQGYQGVAPLFVVGMPRSGTSLLARALSAHVDVHSLGDCVRIRLVPKVLPKLLRRKGQYPRCMLALPPALLSSLARQVGCCLRRGGVNGRRVLFGQAEELWDLGLIHMLLPHARFIHCARNPIDTCLSCYMHDAVSAPYAARLDWLTETWRLYNRIMSHWRCVLPAGTIFDVKYEELIERPAEIIARLLQFCGLSFQEGCVGYYETLHGRKDFASRCRGRERQLYVTSVGRWRRYAPFLGPLLALNEEQVSVGASRSRELVNASQVSIDSTLGRAGAATAHTDADYE